MSEETKPWYKSKAIIGALMAIPSIVVLLLESTGYVQFVPFVEQLVAILASFGIPISIYGRATATQRIKGTVR